MNHIDFLCQLASSYHNEHIGVVIVDGQYVLRKFNDDLSAWETMLKTNNSNEVKRFLRRYIKKVSYKRINAEIPLGLHDKLKQVCTSRNRSITSVLEDLIVQYINKAA